MPDGYWSKRSMRSQSRRRFLGSTAAAGAGLAALGLAGCGDDSSGSTTQAPASGGSPAGGASTATKAAAAPTKGGILNVAKNQNDPPKLDPQSALSVALYEINNVYMERLFAFDSTATAVDAKPTVKPVLATKFEQQADGMVLTLDTTAKWHAVAPVNGRALTSTDVKATFDRMLDPATKSPFAGLIKDFVDKITTPTPDTVKLTFKQPFGALIEVLAADFISMMPEEGAKGGYDLEKVWIGTGAFILKKVEPLHYTFEANRAYRKEVLLDGISMVYQDPTALLAAIAAGQLHIAQMLQGQDLTPVRKDRYNIYKLPGIIRQELALMRTAAPLSDKRVRQAVRFALNQDEMLTKSYNGDAKFTGVIPPSSAFAFSEADNRKLFATDLTQAKQLLDAAGQGSGFSGTINQSVIYGPSVASAAEVVAAQLAKIGIKLGVTSQEHATYLKNQYACDYSWNSRLVAGNTGNGMYDWAYKQENTNGLYSIHNCASIPADQGLNDLTIKAISTTDAQQQQAVAGDLQRYLADVCYFVPMACANTNLVARTDLQGFGFSPNNSTIAASPWAAGYWLKA